MTGKPDNIFSLPRPNEATLFGMPMEIAREAFADLKSTLSRIEATVTDMRSDAGRHGERLDTTVRDVQRLEARSSAQDARIRQLEQSRAMMMAIIGLVGAALGTLAPYVLGALKVTGTS